MSSSPRHPHLLYVAWGFPPGRTGGVYRALATANSFARAGWRVSVLTIESRSFERFTGSDASLLEAIHPNVTVIRTPFEWRLQETDMRRFSLGRALLPEVWWRRLRARIDRLGFPETHYGPWRTTAVRAARALHKAHPVDLTIATANPYVDFQVAYALHRSADVPFVMDYRDAWTLDVFSGATVHAKWSRVGRLERRYLAAAREVWFVNPPIRDWHARRYPNRANAMHVVENGWDPALIGNPPPAGPKRKGSLRLGYLGTVTPLVPVGKLLEGWLLAKEQGLLPANASLDIAGYLGYFSNPQAELSRTIATATNQGVSFVGAVAKKAVWDFYGSVEGLILALGEGSYVTSGKVYEYMASGKPILSVHDPRNHTTSVLRDYPLHVGVDEVSASAVAEGLGRLAVLVERATEKERAEASRVGASKSRDTQLAPRVDALTQEFLR